MAEAPKQFGKYRLLSRLGAGGMAETWRAELVAAAGVRKQLVIKRILPVRAEQPGFVEMFIEEARLTASLSHKNLAQVFDFGEADGQYFIAMELVDGVSLAQLLERAEGHGYWHLPYPVALLVGIEICQGLHYAHARVGDDGKPLGIVHRDVSPDNILIGFDGETKLVDFGVAKTNLAGRAETAPGLVKGKYLYLSPEQAVGEPLDGRSDVFAMGTVLYQMVCGELPFDGSQLQVMNAIVNGRQKPPRAANPDLPGPLVKVLERAMANRASKRFGSAHELREALAGVLFGHAPHATAQWVRGFVAFLFPEELAERGRPHAVPAELVALFEQWKPGPRGRPSGPVPRVNTDESTRVSSPDATRREQERKSAQHRKKPERRLALFLSALVLAGVLATGAVLWSLRPASVVQLAPAPAPAPTPKVEPIAPSVPVPPPVAPPVAAEQVAYSADTAPVRFMLDAHHQVSVDALPTLGREPAEVSVAHWPTDTGGRDFQASGLPELPIVLFTRTAQGLDMRLLQTVDRWEGGVGWLAVVRVRSDAANLVYEPPLVVLGEVASEVPGAALALDPNDRFTVRNLDDELGWTLEVVARPKPGETVLPALLGARPLSADGGEVLLDGRPLVRGLAILAPGKHTLRGAGSLWMSQPTVSGLPTASVEVKLAEAGERIRRKRVAVKPPGERGQFSCARVAAVGEVVSNEGAPSAWVTLRGGPGLLVNAPMMSKRGEAQLKKLLVRIRGCRAGQSLVASRLRWDVSGRTEHGARPGWAVELDALTVK